MKEKTGPLDMKMCHNEMDKIIMKTRWHGITFYMTGTLFSSVICESPHQSQVIQSYDGFFCYPEQGVEQTNALPMSWDAMITWCHCNDYLMKNQFRYFPNKITHLDLNLDLSLILPITRKVTSLGTRVRDCLSAMEATCTLETMGEFIA